MVGSDVAVVWVDRGTGKGYAHDYYLDDKSQCSGTRGSCPDTRLGVCLQTSDPTLYRLYVIWFSV